MLDAEERGQLLEGWNATAAEYPLQRGVHRLFEEQVERTPTAPALAFGEERLDYAELNRRANRLAHALIERGIGADRLVGVAGGAFHRDGRGPDGDPQAGGAYVPVDPEYPEGAPGLHAGGQRRAAAAQPVAPEATAGARCATDRPGPGRCLAGNHAENNPGSS
ncbi:AMP-binding protein [Pseudomonas aeruginosa]|nr:AMP-binding protein [Pseudomonas aeruginosa]